MVINGEGTWLADLSDKDLAVVTGEGSRSMLDLGPSRHTAWHRWIYEGTQAVATLLCQPAAAIRLAQAGASPRATALPDAASLMGKIAVIEADAVQIKGALAGRHALLIREHGLLVWGKSPMSVVKMAETATAWCVASLRDEDPRE